MKGIYHSLQPLQRALPPIRSKWVAIASYAILSVLVAAALPGLADRIGLILVRTNGLAIAFIGGLYGYAKWAYAEERWAPEIEQIGAE